MKRLIIILGLLVGIACAQTTTTITGTLKDLTGAVITSGKVTFTLTPSRDTTISGLARFTPTTIVCLINGSGLIKAMDGTSTCTLTMNTALNPPGSYYIAAVWPGFVKTSTFNFYAVLSTYDWSTVVSTPATSPAQNFVDVFSNQTIGGKKTFTGGGIVSTPTMGSYTFSIAGGIVTAMNDTTGVADYSGTDASIVINQVLSSLSNAGGTLYFKNGIYPLNSMTQETATTWTNYFYGIGIPANATAASRVQFHFIGESRPAWIADSNAWPYIANTGVIFDLTPAALASISNTNIALGLFQRPPSGGSGFSNELFLKNIEMRFPSNTRTLLTEIALYNAMTVDLENVSATFNMTVAALSTALPAANTFCIGSSNGSSGNLQHFKNVYVAGCQYGYDIQGEHWIADTVTSAFCTNAGIIGRSGGAIYHPIVMTHVVDQENQNGWILGTNLQLGGRLDMIGLDIELANGGTFARVNNLYETTAGNTNGMITYASVQASVGEVAITLFSHGGSQFLVANGNGWGTNGLAFGAHPFASYSACGAFTEGRHASISDSTTVTWGATITGSGANHVEGYCDGTNWTVEAK